MKIFTLKEFTKLCIDTEMKGQDPRFLGATENKYKKRHKLLKSKEVIKTVKETLLDERGIPYTKTTKGTSKQIPDTNVITKLILDYLRFVYGSSSIRRISSEGKYRPGIGFIPSSNKGMSDIEGIIYGKLLSLEVKVGKDTIRESQLKRKSEIEKDGGIYYLCKWIDFEHFQKEIQELIPIQ